MTWPESRAVEVAPSGRKNEEVFLPGSNVQVNRRAERVRLNQVLGRPPRRVLTAPMNYVVEDKSDKGSYANACQEQSDCRPMRRQDVARHIRAHRCTS